MAALTGFTILSVISVSYSLSYIPNYVLVLRRNKMKSSNNVPGGLCLWPTYRLTPGWHTNFCISQTYSAHKRQSKKISVNKMLPKRKFVVK